MGPCIWPSSAPPRGARLIALRTHAHKNVSTTPLFTQSCKRVRNSLKIRNFNSLSFHTHAHSFAVSPLFATHTQNVPGVYVPPPTPKSKVLLEVAHLSPAPLDTYSDNSAPSPSHSTKPQSPFPVRRVDSTPLLSSTSALFRTLSNLLFLANHFFSSNCALFWKNTRGGGTPLKLRGATAMNCNSPFSDSPVRAEARRQARKPVWQSVGSSGGRSVSGEAGEFQMMGNPWHATDISLRRKPPV